MIELEQRLRDQGKDAFAKHYSLGMWKLCIEAADVIQRLRGALAWIHNSTEPDAIKHSSYDTLAADLYAVAKGGLDGTFVDDMRAAEVYDELYPRASA
jgi:hypothetical protein